MANVPTSTQSSRPLVAILDDAESVGEAWEVLMRSIGYRAESFALTEEFLFSGTASGNSPSDSGFEEAGNGQHGVAGVACGSQPAFRKDRVEIQMSLIVYCGPQYSSSKSTGLSMLHANVKKRFGLAIKNWRAKSDISQEELAWRAGLHRSYVADIERGVRNASLQSIEKLAKALEVSLSVLLQPLGGQHDVVGASPEGEKPVDILLVEDDRNDVELTLRNWQLFR